LDFTAVRMHFKTRNRYENRFCIKLANPIRVGAVFERAKA